MTRPRTPRCAIYFTTHDDISQLRKLNKTMCITDIAAYFRCSSETVRSALKANGIVPLNTNKPAVSEKIAAPREKYSGVFEDHPRGDSDRYGGRRPVVDRASYGCAAALCVGG